MNKNKITTIIMIFLVNITFCGYAQQSDDELKNSLTASQASTYYKLTERWAISPFDPIGMQYKYTEYLSGGAALLTIGMTFISVGTIVTSVLCPITRRDAIRNMALFSGTDPDTAVNNYASDSLDSPDWTSVIIGSTVGGIFLLTGLIMSPISAYPLWTAANLYDIYHKATGKKLTFLQRSRLGGGYDWEHREICMSVSVKL